MCVVVYEFSYNFHLTSIRILTYVLFRRILTRVLLYEFSFAAWLVVQYAVVVVITVVVAAVAVVVAAVAAVTTMVVNHRC